MKSRGDLVPLSDGAPAGLEAVVNRVSFRSGDCLFRLGTAADEAFILIDGTLEISGAVSGISVGIDMIEEPGRLFGWEPLAFGRSARLTAAIATTDGTALRIPAADIADEDALSAAGRLSRRYLLRAAQEAADAYKAGMASTKRRAQDHWLCEPLVALLLRADAADGSRVWSTAVGLLGHALGASRAVLYTASAGDEAPTTSADWSATPDAAAFGEPSQAAGDPPWFWSTLQDREEIVTRDGGVLVLPLHDGSLLRGALSIAFDDAEALPEAPERHGLALLTGVLALDLARRQDGAQLGKLAHKDRLTGLTNGLLFQDRLNLALARARRADRCVALLYLDLDGFDPLNREFGTEVGDRLLKEIARRLKVCARESDTVGRIGDDEFAIMLEDVDGTEAALQAAQRVMTTLNQPIHAEEQSHYVGISVGIAMYPEHAVDAESLIRAGTEAMARAKQMTGSAYALYSSDKDEGAGRRMQVEAQLRAALAARELLAYYQPIVDIKTGRIQGAEALARWPREDGTVLGPGSFLPIAEATGMVIPLSRQILRQACRETVAWNRLFHTRLTAAVNVSTRWLVDPQFLDTVENTLRDTGLPAHCLTLELTEEILSRDLEASERALAGLKALGVKLALDDFGTGHSSLAILERFTIDSIKIDRSFTSAIVTLDDDAPILRGTLALGRELGTSAVAEGVETEVQAGFLRRHGGTLCQGYFFGKPMPSEEFEKRLNEQFGARAAPRHAGEGRTGH